MCLKLESSGTIVNGKMGGRGSVPKMVHPPMESHQRDKSSNQRVGLNACCFPIYES